MNPYHKKWCLIPLLIGLSFCGLWNNLTNNIESTENVGVVESPPFQITQNNTEINEDDTMVKVYDLIDQNKTTIFDVDPSDNIILVTPTLLSTSSLIYDGIQFYYLICNLDGFNPDLYSGIVQYDSDFNYVSIISPSRHYGLNATYASLVRIETSIYSIIISTDTINSALSYRYFAITNPSSTIGASNVFNSIYFKGADITLIGGTVYIVVSDGSAIYFYDTSFNLIASESGSYYYNYKGYTDTNYYYVRVSSTNSSNFEIRMFNGTTLSSVTTMTLSAASINYDKTFLYYSSTIRIIGWESTCWIFNGSIWLNASVPNSNYPVPHWNYDTKQYIQAVTYINTYTKIATPIQNYRLSINHNGIAAWGDYLIEDTNSIFKLQLVSLSSSLQNCSVSINTYHPPDAKIISTEEPIENQYLKLYTDLDVEFYEGYVESYESKQQGIYVYTMRSPIEQDFQKKITVSFVGQTSHYILKYVIDNYCDFLWYNTGISTTPATVYSVEFKNKTIVEIIKWLDQQENYQTSIRPTLEVYRDTYTDSTLTWIENTDFPVTTFTWTKKPLKLSIVKLNGGFVGGSRISVTVYGEANYGYLEDTVSHITDLTQLTAQANAILTNKNVTLIKLHFDIQGKGMLNYGQTVQITSGTYGITDDTYYMVGTLYNAIMDVCEIEMTSAIYIPSTKTNVITGSQAALQNQVNDLEHQVDDLYQSSDQATSQFQTKDLVVSDPLNYKHGSALIWGSGSSGITSTGVITNQTVDGHSQALTIVLDPDETIVNSNSFGLSSGAISFWIRPNQTNTPLDIFFNQAVTGANNTVSMVFSASGTIQLLKTDGGLLTTLQTYTANTWYHIALVFVKNTCVHWYINKIPIYFQTTEIGNYDINYVFMYDFTQSGTFDLDALISTSIQSEAFRNLYAGQVNATGFVENGTSLENKYATKTYADAKVADAINDGTTTIAPSENAVYDALALKIPTSALDTSTDLDGALAADTKISSQLAVKTYADTLHKYYFPIQFHIDAVYAVYLWRGTNYKITSASTSGSMVYTFSVVKGGSFKLEFFTMTTGNTTNMRFTFYMGDNTGGATEWNLASNVTFDAGAHTARTEYKTTSANAYTIADNSIVGLYWAKTSNEGAGDLYLRGVRLIRQ